MHDSPAFRGFSGQASDIDIHAQEILKTRDKLNSILKEHTGQSMKLFKRTLIEITLCQLVSLQNMDSLTKYLQNDNF